MPLVNVAEIRSLIETDLGDTALEILENEAEATIMERYGVNYPGPVIRNYELLDYSMTPPNILLLERSVLTITNIHEFSGEPVVDLTLAANDYRVLLGGTAVIRLATGTNPADVWARRVVITYTPIDDTFKRKKVIIDLIRLGIKYEAVKAHSEGDVSEASVDYIAERENLFSQMGSVIAFS